MIVLKGIDSGLVALKNNGKYLSASPKGSLHWATHIKDHEKFKIHKDYKTNKYSFQSIH